MNKVLIAYVSRTGNTEKMAEYIAEGVRFSGNEVESRKITEIKKGEDLQGYEGYIFGSPTYHRDMMGTMKTFLFLAEKAGLEGKIGGAFGSYTHSGDAPGIILDTMQYVFKMKISDLGSLRIKEAIIGTPDGMKACQDYGRSLGDQLNG
jgi:flavorubredoxin